MRGRASLSRCLLSCPAAGHLAALAGGTRQANVRARALASAMGVLGRQGMQLALRGRKGWSTSDAGRRCGCSWPSLPRRVHRPTGSTTRPSWLQIRALGRSESRKGRLCGLPIRARRGEGAEGRRPSGAPSCCCACRCREQPAPGSTNDPHSSGDAGARAALSESSCRRREVRTLVRLSY